MPVHTCFSALQRAEIAEIGAVAGAGYPGARRFSALQRAEIAEILIHGFYIFFTFCFSALQRAEIAEIALHVDAHHSPA